MQTILTSIESSMSYGETVEGSGNEIKIESQRRCGEGKVCNESKARLIGFVTLRIHFFDLFLFHQIDDKSFHKLCKPSANWK